MSSRATMMTFGTMVISRAAMMTMLSMLSVVLVRSTRAMRTARTSRALGLTKAAFLGTFRFIRAFRITLEAAVVRAVMMRTMSKSAERTSERMTEGASVVTRAEAGEIFRAGTAAGEFFRTRSTSRETFRSGAEFVLPEVERRRAVFASTEFAKVQAEGHAGNFDFKERMLVFLGGFASFAKIEIRAD